MADGKLSEEQEKLLQECFRKFEQLEKQLANLQRVRGVLDAIDDEARVEPIYDDVYNEAMDILDGESKPVAQLSKGKPAEGSSR